MSNPPDLHAVPDPAPGADPAGQGPQDDSGVSRPWVAGLAVALVVALGLLLWSRGQMGGEIDALRGALAEVEERNALLVDQLAQRDALIEAQQGRLADIRDSVLGLIGLLDQPIEPTDPETGQR